MINKNAIRVIQPYYVHGSWVFDDDAVGLVREPFVAGADTIIEGLLREKAIPNPEKGFTLLFSDSWFPDTFEFHRLREEGGGNWYRSPVTGAEGWLCPALFCYFDQAPEKLFVQVKPGAGAGQKPGVHDDGIPNLSP